MQTSKNISMISNGARVTAVTHLGCSSTSRKAGMICGDFWTMPSS